MTDELTKVCTKCGRELPLSEYYADKSRKDGLFPYCKKCQKESAKLYRGTHREELSKKNKVYYETHQSDMITRVRKYYKCVTKPSCSRVGRYGAVFETFTCEMCGTEFRRLKSKVDWDYEHRGSLPRFCSRECLYESQRKTHKSKYAKEIERIKKET